ncbi:MAG TPA: anion transporter [Elusimicrobiota bacterium]|nr:anion transporter [Elusimicrobiota bacterium]
MGIALLVFVVTYLLISFQNIPGVHIRRPAAALLGAVAMVVFGVLRMDESYRMVDYDTLVFILGMMIVIGYLEITGFFEQVENVILRYARTTRQLLALLIASSGVLSALFMNDTICLMLTPVVLRIVKRARLSPNAYLIALATSSNIGSVMTPMGNPQNMIVAIHSGIPFLDFVGYLWPVASVGLVMNYWVIRWVYPAEFGVSRTIEVVSERSPVRTRLLYVCLAAVALLLLLFALNLPPPIVALSVASLLILAGARRPQEAFKHIDWELLLMFAGLFVVMGGLRRSGALESLFGLVNDSLVRSTAYQVGWISGLSTVLSNIVSNVPCVVFFVNLIPQAGDHHSLWLALAMASTLAGNLTLIGSVANLIVFETAKKDARVGFWEYFKAGAPLTVFLIVAGTLYLMMI